MTLEITHRNDDRSIVTLSTVFYRQKFRDFHNWSLNRVVADLRKTGQG